MVFGPTGSPGLSLSQTGDGFQLEVQLVNKQINMGSSLGANANLPVPGHPHDLLQLDNLHTETVDISRVWAGRYADYAGHELVNRAERNEKQNHEFNVGGHLATAIISNTLGAIPKVGPAIGVVDSLNPISTIDQQAAARNSIGAVADAGREGIDITHQRLDTVFITNGDNSFATQTWPSPCTFNCQCEPRRLP